MSQDYDCPACGASAFPCFVPNAKDKLVVQCVRCRHMDDTKGPANFTVGIAAMPSGDVASEAGWKGKTAVVVDMASPPAVARVAPTPKRTEPAAPTDVIGMIEQRAMWLGAEEARLDGEIAGLRAKIAAVKSERKKLDRMLRAAKREEAQASIDHEMRGPALSLMNN